MTTHFQTCHLCEAMCGLAIEMTEGQITSIRGDKDDVFSQGHICPKAVALQDIHEDPDRLKFPQRRRGDRWETISWEDAFEEVSNQLVAIQKRYGQDAVATYLGNPNVHNYTALLYLPSLLKILGTRNRFSATSVDQLPYMLASLLMLGHQLLSPIPDLERTQFLLVLGANPLVSNGSAMTAPGISKRLKALQARGGKLIVIDPRYTETARLADEHFFIQPGTDALLLLAMLHTLFSEGLAQPGRLKNFIERWDVMQEIAKDFPPEHVAERIGISADDIQR